MNRSMTGFGHAEGQVGSAREELNEVGRYHYVVINDDLERAVDQVSARCVS